VDWEPDDAGGHKLEFAVAIAHQEMLVEVKSPGWEAELTQQQRMAGRASQPKYLENIIERGAAGPVQVIRRTVEKACPKFRGKKPALWSFRMTAVSISLNGGGVPFLWHCLKIASVVMGRDFFTTQITTSTRLRHFHAVFMRVLEMLFSWCASSVPTL
jgi:hypothetical protein